MEEVTKWRDADDDAWILLPNGRITIEFLHQFCLDLIAVGEPAGATFDEADRAFGPLVPVTES